MERFGMFSFHDGHWLWNGQPLDLIEPEPALLTVMLKERGTRRLPHVWLALELHQPFSPATGRAFLSTMRRKLEWAGAPESTLQSDPIQGVLVPPEIPVADDDDTRTVLGLAPLPTDGANTA